MLGAVLGGDGNDGLAGGSFDNALFGGADNDLLRGRAGDDILGGGAGTDSLWGGSGLEVFDFDALADSATGLGRDVVADFERGFDLVDLQGIDARAGAAGDQAFRFVGTAAFTAGSAGQLRAFTNAAGTQTIVEGDVDGNAAADFHITLAGSVALSAADFLR